VDGAAAALVAASTAPALAMHGGNRAPRGCDARAEIPSLRENRCAAVVFDTCTDLRCVRSGRTRIGTCASGGTCRRRPGGFFAPKKIFAQRRPKAESAEDSD